MMTMTLELVEVFNLSDVMCKVVIAENEFLHVIKVGKPFYNSRYIYAAGQNKNVINFLSNLFSLQKYNVIVVYNEPTTHKSCYYGSKNGS